MWRSCCQHMDIKIAFCTLDVIALRGSFSRLRRKRRKAGICEQHGAFADVRSRYRTRDIIYFCIYL